MFHEPTTPFPLDNLPNCVPSYARLLASEDSGFPIRARYALPFQSVAATANGSPFPFYPKNMRFPLFDRAGARVCVLREEEAQALYSAGMAAPKGKKVIRALTLTVNRRQAWGFLRGKRGMTSQASRTVIVEHIGPERARLYQHDHERCDGFAGTLRDLVVA